MAGLADVEAIGSSILGFADKIKELGPNWYRATEEWKQFPGQVNQLEERVEFWNQEARNRGLLSVPALIKCLQDAKSSLQEERDNLERREGKCGSGCYPRIKIRVFPATLGLRIQVAIDALNNIPGMLRSQEEAVEALNRARLLMPVSESVVPNSRYVPLQVSEAEICKALDDRQGPALVLLHGGAGKGKSTLARRMVVHYNNLNEDNQKFELVFFLSCGPTAMAEDTLFELIQRLGSEPQATLQDEERNRLLRIRQQVKGLLTARNILLILDDVCDGEFLERIIELCGSEMKCLVTSQLSNLCHRQTPSKYIKIGIQDINEDDARKILASHVELPNQQIPQHVQVLADRMLGQTDFNPLAIASVANAIDQDRADDLSEWEDVSTNFFRALKAEVEAAVFQGKYPHSLWATMGQTISTLNKAAQRLLLLTYAFEGPTIPEEIVQLLYQSSKLPGDFGIFSNVRRDLKSRQLIKIISPALPGSSDNLGKQITWSVHSLQKRYIEEEMNECRDSMFISLVGRDSDTTGPGEGNRVINGRQIEDTENTVVKILCALYFDKDLAERAVSKLSMSISQRNFNNLRRNAIEPITLLLGCSVSDRWTETARHHTIQVFKAYILEGALDDKGVSYLLALPITAPAMWKTLQNITFIIDFEGEEGNIVDEKTTPLIMAALVDRLAEGVESGLQQEALRILHNLAYNYLNCLCIASSPGILEGILRILRTSSNSSVQKLCAWALRRLAWNPPDPNNKLEADVKKMLYEKMKKLVNYPGLLDGLLNALSEDTNPALQEHAAKALTNLALYREHTSLLVSILNHDGVLSALVNSLSKEANPTLQINATWVLTSLAMIANAEIKQKVILYPGMLSELVKLLAKDKPGHPLLQEQAADVLANLATPVAGPLGDWVTTPMQIIAEHPAGAILELVKSLIKDTSPRLQVNAAWALASLALGDVKTKAQIINTEEALSNLAKSLSKEGNPGLQNYAAWAIAQLADGDLSSKDRIVNYRGLLSELMNSLLKDVNPTLQSHVAWAVANLASGDVKTKAQIVNYPGALSELVNSLSKDANPALQEQAARAIANVASGDVKTKAQIVNYMGALSKLVNALPKDTNPPLQGQAARAIANLASGDVKTKAQIVNYTGVLSELVNSLSKDVNPSLQEQAARAIANLTDGA